MCRSIHFVNLVTWRQIKVTDKSVFYVDTVSMSIAVFLITGNVIKRNPGMRFIKNLNFEDCMVLSSKGTESSVELPFFTNMVEIEAYSQNLCKSITKRNVVLGISSPKQDLLAQLLIESGFNGDVFCLGAAVEHVDSLSILDRVGMNWIYLLVRKPKRGFSKILKTFSEILYLIFSHSKRAYFREFAKKLERNY